jgi:hypothetical protein
LPITACAPVDVQRQISSSYVAAVLPQIPRDPEQRIKGFGFVTFEDFDSMDRAIRKVNGLLVRLRHKDKATHDGQTHRQGCWSYRKATTAQGQQGRQNRQPFGPHSNSHRPWS